MENCREVFDAVLRNVGKIRDGKPRAQVYFATTGRAISKQINWRDAVSRI
jgi:hypothetical protein